MLSLKCRHLRRSLSICSLRFGKEKCFDVARPEVIVYQNRGFRGSNIFLSKSMKISILGANNETGIKSTFLTIRYKRDNDTLIVKIELTYKTFYSSAISRNIKGRFLSLLLKRSSLIDEISLYDKESTDYLASELNQVDTRCKVTTYPHNKESLTQTLQDAKVVVLVAGKNLKYESTPTELLESNAEILSDLLPNVIRSCPRVSGQNDHGVKDTNKTDNLNYDANCLPSVRASLFLLVSFSSKYSHLSRDNFLNDVGSIRRRDRETILRCNDLFVGIS